MDHAYQAYVQFLEKDVLKSDMTLPELEGELNRFWDGVMLLVTQATTDTSVRNAYRILVRQARVQAQALQWLGEPEVFYSTSGADRGKRRIPWLGIGAGILLAGLTVWLAVPHENVESKPYLALAAGIALVLAGIQLFMLWNAVPASPTVNIRTESRIDPARVRSGLQQLARDLDSHAESLCAMMDETAPKEVPVDLHLVQELLRLPKDRRDPAVMDAVDRYLVRQGVEKLDYTPDRQAMFMILPGPTEMTVEPALVRDGQLLQMGVACVPMEG